jgi:hypothetical protein
MHGGVDEADGFESDFSLTRCPVSGERGGHEEQKAESGNRSFPAHFP